jgi:ubiquinone/menaquinone biosynthesis C-methylase UbiE
MGDDYYNSIAPGYSELHGEEQLRKAEIVLQNLDVKQTDSLLDVGCGNAKYLSVFPCKKAGIDPSCELLKQASVPVVQGVAEKLPFPDNSFDIVLSLTAIHNFDDPQQGLKEMLRVSKCDIAVSVLKKSGRFNEIEKFITELLPVRKRIEEAHDVIFFARKV